MSTTTTTTTISDKMNSNSIWREIKHTRTSITFYPKCTTTWKEMNTWLEGRFKDRHWTWRGFGEEGEEDFQVILVRRECYGGPGQCAWCDDDDDDDEDE